MREPPHPLILAFSKRRVALGMSQAGLGYRVGFSQSMIADLESGRRNLSFQSMLKLAHALGMEIVVQPIDVIPLSDQG